MKNYRDPTKRDYLIGIGLLLAYLIILALSGYFLIPKYWVWWSAIFIMSTIFLIINQNRNTACRCRDCGHEFEVSFLVNLTSPHGVDQEGSWQSAKCPNCGKRGRATVLKAEK